MPSPWVTRALRDELPAKSLDTFAPAKDNHIMTNDELIEYLERRLIVARINTFDGGQTIAWYHSSTGSVRITSEWGDPSLAELVERRFPFLFPEDDPTVEFIPTIIEGV